jgi:pilus assembly protein CpaB
MSIRTILIVLLALVFGGSAAVGINKLRTPPPPPPEPETVPVVVAAKEVPRATTVSAQDLTTREYPKEHVPPEALTSIDEAVGRVTEGKLFKGEPILDAKLAARDAGRGMAALVRPGMRAFTIQTPSISAGVAGFIQPDNKVDVLLTANGHGSHDTGRTVTLLQEVRILAVDQRIEAAADNKVDVKELRSVTLEVTPEQAAKLTLGQNRGVLHLSLRNQQDREAAKARRVTMSDLDLGEEKPPEVPKVEKEAPPPRVEKPAPKPAPRPAPPVSIRTLRGSYESRVLIYPGR